MSTHPKFGLKIRKYTPARPRDQSQRRFSKNPGIQNVWPVHIHVLYIQCWYNLNHPILVCESERNTKSEDVFFLFFECLAPRTHHQTVDLSGFIYNVYTYFSGFILFTSSVFGVYLLLESQTLNAQIDWPHPTLDPTLVTAVRYAENGLWKRPSNPNMGPLYLYVFLTLSYIHYICGYMYVTFML